MCKKMLLAVLHSACAFAAISKLHLRIRKLGAAADHTFVLAYSRTRARLGKLCLKLLLTPFLFSADMVLVQPEKQKKIYHSKNYLQRICDSEK
jgi:hypothetical protein